jgi:hypothetical protein
LSAKTEEIAEDIFVTIPHAASLKSLGKVKILQLLSDTSVSLLKRDIVGIDTSSAGGQGSCEWQDLNGIGGFYLDINGNQRIYHAKRTYTRDTKSIEGKWSVSIDGAAYEPYLFLPMLKSFAKFCSERVITYHTAAAQCDFKRLNSVFTGRTAGIISTGSPFPPFETGWLNTGQDLYRRLIGPKGVPITSTHWKLSIIHDDLYSLKNDPSVSVPLGNGIVIVPIAMTNVLSDAMKTWN